MKEDYGYVWLRIPADEDFEYDVVVPNLDKKPHGKYVSKNDYDLITKHCRCNPRINEDEKIIVHNSYDGREWKEIYTNL